MIKKILVQQLRVGMYVCGNDRKWLDTPFFRSKFPVDSAKQIKDLAEYCRFVYINTEKGLDVRAVESNSERGDSSADLIYQRCRQCLDDNLKAKTLDSDLCSVIVRELLDGFAHYHDQLLILSFGAAATRGANLINTTILALALGNHIKLQDGQLQSLGVNVLMHDSGTDSRFAGSLLRAVVELATAVNKVCQSRFAEQPLAAEKTLEMMMTDSPEAVDAGLLADLMSMLRVYPVNCVVELDSGELACVAEVVEKSGDPLQVYLLTDPHKQLLEQASVLKLSADGNGTKSVVRVLPMDEPMLSVLFMHKPEA